MNEGSAPSPAARNAAPSEAHDGARHTGTFTVKRGLADMLRGGVIMDVVTAEQARIAEDAGAVAVMALERVPADIRAQGGVARMSDPALIEAIQAGGHDPGDGQGPHRPLRRGAGARRRSRSTTSTRARCSRPPTRRTTSTSGPSTSRSSAAPRTSGRRCGGSPRARPSSVRRVRPAPATSSRPCATCVRSSGTSGALTQADAAERYGWAKQLPAPIDLVQEVAETGRLPVPLFCAGRDRHAGRRRAGDAARSRGRLRGLGDLQERGPRAPGAGHRRGDDALSTTRRSSPR